MTTNSENFHLAAKLISDLVPDDSGLPVGVAEKVAEAVINELIKQLHKEVRLTVLNQYPFTCAND